MIVDCVFCAIAAGDAPATIMASWPDTLIIVPLNPVTAGHVIAIPRVHVRDFTERPDVTALTTLRASEFAADMLDAPFNLITSKGREATQSVFHLHVHLVPRRADDGLHLPWTGQGGH